MATTTTNLGLTKPALSESADVGVINDNSDKIDVEAGKSRANFAATYSASTAYAVGAYCERGGNLYRCTTAIPSGGEAWNSGHWTQVAVTGEIPKVIDNLTSTSASAALSAKQGKTLADKIGVLQVQDYGTATPTVPVQINVENSAKGVLFTIGSSDALCSEYILFTSSTGTTSARTVKSGSNVTVATDTNKFTVTPSTGGTYVYVLWFS